MPKARPKLIFGKACSFENPLKAIPEAIGRGSNLGNAESKDPDFALKYRKLRRLYRRRPKNGRRICVDEFGPLNLQPHHGKCLAKEAMCNDIGLPFADPVALGIFWLPTIWKRENCSANSKNGNDGLNSFRS